MVTPIATAGSLQDFLHITTTFPKESRLVVVKLLLVFILNIFVFALLIFVLSIFVVVWSIFGVV